MVHSKYVVGIVINSKDYKESGVLRGYRIEGYCVYDLKLDKTAYLTVDEVLDLRFVGEVYESVFINSYHNEYLVTDRHINPSNARTYMVDDLEDYFAFLGKECIDYTKYLIYSTTANLKWAPLFDINGGLLYCNSHSNLIIDLMEISIDTYGGGRYLNVYLSYDLVNRVKRLDYLRSVYCTTNDLQVYKYKLEDVKDELEELDVDFSNEYSSPDVKYYKLTKCTICCLSGGITTITLPDGVESYILCLPPTGEKDLDIILNRDLENLRLYGKYKFKVNLVANREKHEEILAELCYLNYILPAMSQVRDADLVTQRVLSGEECYKKLRHWNDAYKAGIYRYILDELENGKIQGENAKLLDFLVSAKLHVIRPNKLNFYYYDWG